MRSKRALTAGQTDDRSDLAWSIQACRHKHKQRDVVEQYYAAFDAHTEGWKDLVTDDVVFDGPVQHARGKAEFVGLTGQFLQAHRETRLLSRMAQDNEVASVFEFVIDAPNGERMTCPVAEWATVIDGRIKEFRVYYDPRAFVRAFGISD